MTVNGLEIDAEMTSHGPEMDEGMINPELKTDTGAEVFAPEDDLLYDLADLFRMFADSTRVRILYALMNSEKAVTEIANSLNMTTSAISHQLRILKDAKLVSSRRDGKTILYSLADEHVRTILSMGMEHVLE